MDRPQNATELRMFIGCINYHQDMWPSLAHILKPLTDHSGLKKRAPIPWTPEMQTALDKMCMLMATDSLAAYPDHNKWFDVYTDASDYQLGACIVQEGCPVAYFSHKLSKSQQNYMVMGKEMLSIVATLGEFQGIFCSSDIHIFTDHKNLTFDTLKMQRDLHWHNKVKEFSPTLHYIEGPCNILADNLSKLNCLITPAQIAEGKCLVEPTMVSDDKDGMYFLTQEYSGYHEDDLAGVIKCYLNLLEIPHPDCNPLNYTRVWELQQQDEKLPALHNKYPDNYVKLKLDDNIDDIICYNKDPTQDNWIIAFREEMVLTQSSGSTKEWCTLSKTG